MSGPDAAKAEPSARRSRAVGAEDAFDLWLQRQLSQMFDAVAEEPLPEDLLELLRRGDPKPKS
jgi:hypothetical protein